MSEVKGSNFNDFSTQATALEKVRNQRTNQEIQIEADTGLALQFIDRIEQANPSLENPIISLEATDVLPAITFDLSTGEIWATENKDLTLKNISAGLSSTPRFERLEIVSGSHFVQICTSLHPSYQNKSVESGWRKGLRNLYELACKNPSHLPKNIHATIDFDQTEPTVAFAEEIFNQLDHGAVGVTNMDFWKAIEIYSRLKLVKRLPAMIGKEILRPFQEITETPHEEITFIESEQIEVLSPIQVRLDELFGPDPMTGWNTEKDLLRTQIDDVAKQMRSLKKPEASVTSKLGIKVKNPPKSAELAQYEQQMEEIVKSSQILRLQLSEISKKNIDYIKFKDYISERTAILDLQPTTSQGCYKYAELAWELDNWWKNAELMAYSEPYKTYVRFPTKDEIQTKFDELNLQGVFDKLLQYETPAIAEKVNKLKTYIVESRQIYHSDYFQVKNGDVAKEHIPLTHLNVDDFEARLTELLSVHGLMHNISLKSDRIYAISVKVASTGVFEVQFKSSKEYFTTIDEVNQSFKDRNIEITATEEEVLNTNWNSDRVAELWILFGLDIATNHEMKKLSHPDKNRRMGSDGTHWVSEAKLKDEQVVSTTDLGSSGNYYRYRQTYMTAETINLSAPLDKPWDVVTKYYLPYQDSRILEGWNTSDSGEGSTFGSFWRD